MEMCRILLFCSIFVVAIGFLTENGKCNSSTTGNENMAKLLVIIEEEKSLRHQLEDFVSNIKNDLDRLQAKSVNESEMEKRLQDLEEEALQLKTQNEDQQKMIEELNKNQSLLLNQIQRDEIAFSAVLPGTTDVTSSALIFSKIITNIGGGFNFTDGVFYCPKDGLYLFDITVSSYNRAYADAYVMKNGNKVQFMYSSFGSLGYPSTSMSIVLRLQRGDKIWVQGEGYKYYAYSFFTGVLIN